MKTRKGNLSKGFTLIEMILAMSIMLIISGFVVYLSTHVLDAWNQASAVISSDSDAEKALEILAEDLESAIINNAGNQWIYITKEDSADVGDSAKIDRIYFFSPVLMRLREIAPEPPDTEYIPISGNICAVSYRIVYQNPASPSSTHTDDKRFGLYRTVVDPEITFNDFLGSTKQASASSLTGAWTGSITNSLQLIGGDLKRSYGTASSTAEDYSKEPLNLLALNIVELEYIPVFFNGSNENYLTADDVLLPQDSPAGQQLIGIDILMTVISDEGDYKLRHETSMTLNKLMDDSVNDLSYHRQYRRRVPLSISGI